MKTTPTACVTTSLPFCAAQCLLRRTSAAPSPSPAAETLKRSCASQRAPWSSASPRYMRARDVPGRMRTFRIRKDRAEVIGIAAIIFNTLAKWLDLRTMLVPGVGVREGILLDLVREQYSAGSASEEEKGRAAEMREGAF